MCEADFHFSFLFSPFFMHFHIKAHILIFFFARFVFQFEMFLISIQHFFSGRFSRSHLSGRDKNAGGSFRFFHPLLSYLVWHLHVMKYIVCECWHTKKKITSYFQKFIFINKKEKSIFMENFKWHQKYNVPTISREKKIKNELYNKVYREIASERLFILFKRWVVFPPILWNYGEIVSPWEALQTVWA